MYPLVCALVATAQPSTAAAQDLWERTLDPGSAEARVHVAAAEDYLRVAGRAVRAAQVMAEPPPPIEPLLHIALAYYHRALTAAPDDVPTLAAAASVAERLGDHADASRWIDHALALRPDGPDATSLLFDRALVHTREDRFDAARDDYLQELAFPLDPSERAVVLGNLADTYVSLGDLGRAEDAYARCVADAPGYPLGWLGLAVTYDRDGRDESVESARRALATAGGALVESLDSPSVFFVPDYDRYYYAGVAHEAEARSLDDTEPAGALRRDLPRREALAAWHEYLRVAPATDPWLPRVRAHVTALEAPRVSSVSHPPRGARRP